MPTREDLAPEVRKLLKSWSSRGGKNGSRASKQKAGRKGGLARAKKYFSKNTTTTTQPPAENPQHQTTTQ